MMKLSRSILPLVLLLTGLAQVGADDKKIVTTDSPCGPWYLSIFGGGAFYTDGDWFGSHDLYSVAGYGQADFDFSDGWMFGGAAGMRTGNNWRLEIELSHNEASGDTVSLADSAYSPETFSGALRGDVAMTSFLVNVAKEFENLAIWRLRPYLGAGLGVRSIRTDLTTDVADGGFFYSNSHFTGDEAVFGYQFMGGLVFDLAECVEGYVEYRYSGQSDPEDLSIDEGYFEGQSGSFDIACVQHVILGLRWFF